MTDSPSSLCAATIRYDRQRVNKWSLQAEGPSIAHLLRCALTGNSYARERGLFDIALSGGVPQKVPAKAFDGHDRGKWELRQAVVLFDPLEVEKWDVREDAVVIAGRLRDALLKAGPPPDVPGIVSISLHSGEADIRAMVRPKDGIEIDGRIVREVGE